METPFNVPSDVPVDPVPDGDVIDSPVSPVDDESRESEDVQGTEIPD